MKKYLALIEWKDGELTPMVFNTVDEMDGHICMMMSYISEVKIRLAFRVDIIGAPVEILN